MIPRQCPGGCLWSVLGRKVLPWDVEGMKKWVFTLPQGPAGFEDLRGVICKTQAAGTWKLPHLSEKGNPLWFSISCAFWLHRLLPRLEGIKLGHRKWFRAHRTVTSVGQPVCSLYAVRARSGVDSGLHPGCPWEPQKTVKNWGLGPLHPDGL